LQTIKKIILCKKIDFGDDGSITVLGQWLADEARLLRNHV